MRDSAWCVMLTPLISTRTTRLMAAGSSWCITIDTSADCSGDRLGLNAAFSRYEPLTIRPDVISIAHPDGDFEYGAYERSAASSACCATGSALAFANRSGMLAL